MMPRILAAAAICAAFVPGPAHCEEIVVLIPRVVVKLPNRNLNKLAIKPALVVSEADQHAILSRMSEIRDISFLVTFEFVANNQGKSMSALDARLIRERLELEVEKLIRPQGNIKVLFHELAAQ